MDRLTLALILIVLIFGTPIAGAAWVYWLLSRSNPLDDSPHHVPEGDEGLRERKGRG